MSAPATGRTSTIACPNCGKQNRVPGSAGSAPKCGNCHERLPWIADAGDSDFADVVEHAPIPVLVDLWATWCAPCRMVSPALEKLAVKRAGKLKLVKVDVDQAPELSQRFEVRSVPTLLVMRKGEVLARQSGAAPKPALRRWLDGALSGDSVQ